MTRKKAPFRDEDLSFEIAKNSDARALHGFGCTIPELKVTDDGDFMTLKELKAAIANQDGVMYVAFVSNRIVGFCYANVADTDRPKDATHACLVYLAVAPKFRGFGIAARLYEIVGNTLCTRGVVTVHALAHPTSGIIEFMKRRGYRVGHPLVWMDGKL